MLPKTVCNGAWNDLNIDSIGAIIRSNNLARITSKANYLVLEGTLLILSDLHIGIDNHFEKKGMNAFVKNSEETIEYIINNIIRIKKSHTVDWIIVNGDLIDEYSLRQKTRNHISNLLYNLSELGNLVIIRGNHDVMLQTFNLPSEIRVVDYVVSNDILIFHGDKDIKEIISADNKLDGIKRIIISHEHPAIIISDGIRQEKVKAYLFLCNQPTLKNKKASVLVLPSSNPDIEGSDIFNGFMSPILKKFNTKDTHLFIVENENVLYFGNLQDYKKDNSR